MNLASIFTSPMPKFPKVPSSKSQAPNPKSHSFEPCLPAGRFDIWDLGLGAFFLVLFSCTSSPGQPLSGIPFIRNYPPREYNAGTGNWAILQDKRGILYFGNSKGILEYDGVRWNEIQVANLSIVRSLAMDSTGTIYAGAVGEFGYLAVNASGDLEYRSLCNGLADNDREFGDVWKTYATPEGIFFQTFDKIFIYDKGKIKILYPENTFHLSFFVNGFFYVNSRGIGLKKYRNGILEMTNGGEFFADKRIYCMVPYREGKIFAGTREAGFFILDENNPDSAAPVVPLPTMADGFLAANMLYHGAPVSSLLFAFGTLRGGVLFTGFNGDVFSVINKQNSLQNDNVKYLYTDHQNGLWMALDDGISRAEILSPVTFFNDMAGLKGGVEAVTEFSGSVYAGTTQGIFYLSMGYNGHPLNGEGDAASFIRTFKPVESISSPCWALLPATIAGQSSKLLAAATDGIYEITGEKASLVTPAYGFALHQLKKNRKRFFTGLQNGLASLAIGNGRWQEEGLLPGIEVEIRSIAEDVRGDLWLGAPFNGIIKVEFDPMITGRDEKFQKTSWEQPYRVIRYDTSHGLPSMRYDIAFQTDTSPLFGTDQGLYRFDFKTARFIPEARFGKEFSDGSRQVFCFAIASQDTSLLYTSTGLVNELNIVIMKNGTRQEIINRPFMSIRDYEVHSVYPGRGGKVWLGTTNGLVAYDPSVSKDYDASFPALMRKCTAGRDSVIFNGTFTGDDGSVSEKQPAGRVPLLPYSLNTMTFEFACASYDNEKANRYRWFLEGNDKEWTSWSSETKAKYNNLSEGNYVFHLFAQNIYGTQSEEALYAFTILPPWYRTWWAYSSYVLLMIGLIYGTVQISIRRLKQAKIQLEKIVAERTAEVVKQKGEIEGQKVLLEKKNKDITDSINYARQIQEAILPRDEVVRALLPDSFVLFRPKDIVSGDFYWLCQLPASPIGRGAVLLSASDCTGHGVPGAFMSMLCTSLLNKAVNDKGIHQPAAILDDVRKGVIEALQQRGMTGEQKDGMDSSLCRLDFDTLKLQWAGANNPLFILRPGIAVLYHTPPDRFAFTGSDLLEIKADKQPVAISDNLKPFTNQEIQLQKGDILYMLSDGYEDQFGGPHGKKFKIKQLKELILSIRDLTMEEQKKVLDRSITEWQMHKDAEGKPYEQVDDIVVLGVRV